jgi:hypothetical protein
MLEMTEIQEIMSHFGLSMQSVTNFYDTSRDDADKRLNYIIDDKYVLKIHSTVTMWEKRLQEIHRLISRYHSIGIYCPSLLPTLDGMLSYTWEKDGMAYTCFVEEYAIYPVLGWGREHDRKEVIEHLGVLAAKYTGVDLSETKTMWSIIDLAPLDIDIDEKQENTNALIEALRKEGYVDLGVQVDIFNTMLREKIMAVFSDLPRCVYQGDLNSTNELHKDGHFVGLIDFNMAGTDVNINVFLNETNWFPEDAEFDSLSVEEIIAKQDMEQYDALTVILRHYELSDVEKYALPYYKRIIDMFQYPNVCSMVEWLSNDVRKDKCVALIEALLKKPF